MAVCGRCLICGYKFDGRLDDDTTPDEAVRWECKRTGTCADRAARREFDEPHEHAICTKCHDHLVDDTAIGAVAAALLALVRERVVAPSPVDTDPLVQALRQKVVSTYYDHHGDWPEEEYVDDMMKQIKDQL